jgi:dihydroneopterin aldolase/2-amino-4-hydroxy-6-hydroxymethyldihydropteridine diphosphokinase
MLFGQGQDYNCTDEIIIEELNVYAHHGVYSEEREKGQNFYVNAVLTQDTYMAGVTDDLEKSTNYAEVCQYITEWMQSHTFNLLEAVAEQLACDILHSFELVKAVELEIRKPEAPINLPFKSVSVHIKRGWHTAYIAVGSNMGAKEVYIGEALSLLGAEKHTEILRTSNIINTKPYGGVEQDDFLNGVIKIRTLLPPDRLLDFLHEIEQKEGRERILHWGPRTLDLDIIFYDRIIYDDDNLVIPHIDMENREFVLKPMCELAPNYRHPVLNLTMRQLLDRLECAK